MVAQTFIPQQTTKVIHLSDRLLPQSKDTLVPPIIQRHLAVTIHISDFAFVDFVMTPVILATLKILI